MKSEPVTAQSTLIREMDGQRPVTDYKSKTVMMAGERNDRIEIVESVETFCSDSLIPDSVSVIKRTETYHGPELLVHWEDECKDYNYLLTAPGPGSHLCLWAGEINGETGKRTGWYPAAEVKAKLAVEQPPYEECEQCGELIRTIHHERESVIGNCSRA